MFPAVSNLAHDLLFRMAMTSSLDSIYKKLAPSLETGGAGHGQDARLDSARHISPGVAHELNNILTIIKGYADRLRLKNADNPALEPHLKLIAEAAWRAAAIVRDATPKETSPPAQPQPNLPTTVA